MAQKRSPTPITKALKERHTNPTLYANQHGFNKKTFEAVTQGYRFTKDVVLQLMKDDIDNGRTTFIEAILETFKEELNDGSTLRGDKSS